MKKKWKRQARQALCKADQTSGALQYVEAALARRLDAQRDKMDAARVEVEGVRGDLQKQVDALEARVKKLETRADAQRALLADVLGGEARPAPPMAQGRRQEEAAAALLHHGERSDER